MDRISVICKLAAKWYLLRMCIAMQSKDKTRREKEIRKESWGNEHF